MQMEITFPGGARVDVACGPHIVHTDQTVNDGGGESAPSPFDLFLTSLGACAGSYVLRFLQQRKLPTAGVRMTERVHADPATGMTDRVDMEIGLPAGFPEKYVPALIRGVEKCTVMKHLAQPPAIAVTVVPDRIAAS